MNKAIFLIMTLFTCGCTLIIPTSGVSVSRGGSPSSMDSELREYRAVFHCHSHLSHDSEGEIDYIAQSAREQGFNIVFMNDHYANGILADSPRGDHGGVLFIPGVETRFPKAEGQRRKASVLGNGFLKDYEKNMPYEERVDQFIEQDGFLTAGHVERLSPTQDLAKFRGFEAYNLHAEFTGANRFMLLWRFLFYPLDCFLESTISTPEMQLARWDKELISGKQMTPFAGHDAHANLTILWRTLNDYPPLFRLFSTRILAKRLDQDSIFDALERGRTFITFDYLGESKGFSMRYGMLDNWAIIGDNVPYNKQANLEIHLPATATIRILRNGKEIAKKTGSHFSSELPGKGVYRTEVYKDGSLWILSGPMYLK
ncbi:hypothetical protein [Candidatus Uabimicrobium sp. HlEnr_7]|uniref:hypothetical protein n=1 Tax=Candidatus Uabimicrobium helgolandensis TaxID=3095367 RepID=UPI003555F7C7